MAMQSKLSLVIPHNLQAEAQFSRFLRGAKVESTDLQTLVRSRTGDDFRTQIFEAARFQPDNPLSDRCTRVAATVPWNPPTQIFSKKEVLPTNDSLVSGEKLERMNGRLVQNLLALKKLLHGKNPITLLDYYDASDVRGCFTTQMLRDTLGSILGDYYDDLVSHLRANLRSPGAIMVGDPEKYLRNFTAATGGGGIVIGGGTFNDADDIHGRWFQQHVMSQLFENPLVYSLMICWSYQVMARTIARKLGIDLHILNGALKWGTFPVEVLRQGAVTPVFSGRSRVQNVTGVFTHSDHVVFHDPVKKIGDLRVGHKNVRDNRHVKIIARDPLTGLPCGYTTDDGRVVAFAFHPEINFGNDLEIIRDFVRREMGPFIDGRYDVTVEQLQSNFDPSDGNRPLVRHDFGPAFYTGTLLSFTELLLRQLR